MVYLFTNSNDITRGIPFAAIVHTIFIMIISMELKHCLCMYLSVLQRNILEYVPPQTPPRGALPAGISAGSNPRTAFAPRTEFPSKTTCHSIFLWDITIDLNCHSRTVRECCWSIIYQQLVNYLPHLKKRLWL